MNWDKLSELCQCAAILAMVANDLLLQQRIRRLERKLQDLNVEIMAEGIKKALLQRKREKEANDGTTAE